MSILERNGVISGWCDRQITAGEEWESQIDERINSAKIVDLARQPQNEIHFGSIVTLFKEVEDCECHYQIVGVDEANISLNKISFLSPIAMILLNKKKGDIVTLKTPKGNRVMQITNIEYPKVP